MSNVIPFRRKEHNTILEMHLLCYLQDHAAVCDMASALEREYRVKVIICDPESVSPGEAMLLEFYGDRVESMPIGIEYGGDDE